MLRLHKVLRTNSDPGRTSSANESLFRVIVIEKYEASSSEELDIDIGQIVLILDANPNSKYQWLAEFAGCIGWIPSQYFFFFLLFFSREILILF